MAAEEFPQQEQPESNSPCLDSYLDWLNLLREIGTIDDVEQRYALKLFKNAVNEGVYLREEENGIRRSE